MPDIVPLSEGHQIDGFACGNGQLDSWLTRALDGLREIPVLLLSKLAVASSAQGTGAGSALLGHAVRQALSIREMAGARMLAAHPVDDSARAWYQRRGMQVTRDESLCYARLKDLVD